MSSRSRTPVRRLRLAAAAALILTALAPAAAQAATTLTIDGRSNVYAAGQVSATGGSTGGGLLPQGIALPSGTSRKVTFSSVTGGTGCGEGGTGFPADGGTGCGGTGTDMAGTNGLSGIKADNGMFLAGVFISDATPSGAGITATDYTGAAANQTTISPAANQVFRIGDGRTTGGTVQQFVPPSGATRLYLGFVDGTNGTAFHGSPGYYDDNTGALSATLSVTPTPPAGEAIAQIAGTDDVWAAGRAAVPAFTGGGGTLPKPVALPAGDPVAVKFPSVAGAVGCAGYGSAQPPDGGSCIGYGATDLDPFEGIAGVRSPGTTMLIGVFLDATAPSAPAPSTIDHTMTTPGRDFTTLSPVLRQPFVVGDGRTSTGAVQSFVAPPGATRLFLAVADGPGPTAFERDQGGYEDNVGSFSARAVIAPTGAKPNLVRNGGFELPEVMLGSYTTFAAGETFGGWTATGDGIDLTNRRFYTPSYESHSGEQLVDTNHYSAGGLWQNVHTAAGASYMLSFWMAPNGACGGGTDKLGVSWDGSPLAPASAQATDGQPPSTYKEYTYMLPAPTGTATRLEFTSLGSVASCGPALDDVSVTAVGTAPAANDCTISAPAGVVGATLKGTSGPDVICGTSGDDTLSGEGGNDRIYGGGGNDTIGGGTGDDKLYGGDGNDVLDGAAGKDQFHGDDGFDQASYAKRTSAVKVTLPDGTDSAADDGGSGGAEGDNVFNDIEWVMGGAGNDTLTGSSRFDRLSGGPGRDQLVGGYGRDRLDGGLDADTLSGGPDQDGVGYDNDGRPADQGLWISIGDGSTAGRNDGAIGADGSTEGDDVRSDIEHVIAWTGDDTIIGDGDDNDVLAGGGDDDVFGGGGNDTLIGGAGKDLLAGDAGADTLDGESDADSMYGGSGLDLVSYGALDVQLGFNYTPVDARTAAVRVSVGDTVADGEGGGAEGDDVRADVENVTGGDGPDLIAGNWRANVLRGGKGADTLTGGAGKDKLFGELGSDTLNSYGDPSSGADTISCDTAGTTGGTQDQSSRDSVDVFAASDGCETKSIPTG